MDQSHLGSEQKDKHDSLRFEKELVAFEEWSDQNQSSDFELFAKERSLNGDLADCLRDFLDEEKTIESLVAYDPNAEPLKSELSDLAGVKLGKYRFIRRLGTGGMGTVWLAEQLESVQRLVAIKLMRPGMDPEVLLKRFEAERQALALMSHPNIAKVLDAGTFDQDRPFIVMEYVDGIPLTNYCNLNRLSLNERLRLFIQLCEAIQHAHDKKLLHRDIKPTNILVSQVSARPFVKVIDFGLSKIITDGVSPAPQITKDKTAIGSPLWMSPEQTTYKKNGKQAVDARSDIYSLGVILFQLITNTTPITQEFYASASTAELVEAIQEEPAPFPSIRLRHASETTQWLADETDSNLSKWSSLLRDDLDWITTKALSKEPMRRYQSVAAFALDVRNFINGESVSARPPSKMYRLKKMIGKHRTWLVTSAAIAVMLIGFGIYSNRMTKQSTRLDNRSNIHRDLLQNRVARNDVFNPGVTYSESHCAELFSTLDDIDQLDFKDNRPSEADLRLQIANALVGAGKYESSIQQFQNVVDIRSKHFGENAEPTVVAKLALSDAYLLMSDTIRAREIVSGCFEDEEGIEENSELSFLRQIVLNRVNQFDGKNNKVVRDLETLIPIAKNTLSPDHVLIIDAKTTLAKAHFDLFHFSKSAELIKDTLDLAEKAYGADHKKTIELGILHWHARFQTGNASTYELNSRLKHAREKFGEAHPFTLQLSGLRGSMPDSIQNAISAIQKNVTVATSNFGESHVEVAKLRMLLGSSYYAKAIYDPDHFDKGLLAKAIYEMKLAVQIFKDSIGQDSNITLEAQSKLANAFFRTKQYDESLKITSVVPPPWEIKVNQSLTKTLWGLWDRHAQILADKGRFQESLKLYKGCLEIYQKRSPDELTQIGFIWFRIASVRGMARAAPEECAIAYENAIELLKDGLGMDAGTSHAILRDLIRLLLKLRQLEKAESWIRFQADNISEKTQAREMFLEFNFVAKSELLVEQGKFDEALATLEKFENLEAGEKGQAAEKAFAIGIRGKCLANNGEFESAEKDLLTALESLKARDAPNQKAWYRFRCLEWMANLHTETGDLKEAIHYEEMLESEKAILENL